MSFTNPELEALREQAKGSDEDWLRNTLGHLVSSHVAANATVDGLNLAGQRLTEEITRLRQKAQKVGWAAEELLNS